LYVSTNDSIKRYNINTLTIDSTWELEKLPGARGICIKNDILYILNISNGKLSYFNINTPTSSTTFPTLTDIVLQKAEDIIIISNNQTNTLYITNPQSNNIVTVDADTKTYTLEKDYCGFLGNPDTNNINITMFNNDIYISNYTNSSIYKLNVDNTVTKYNTGIPNILGMYADTLDFYISNSISINRTNSSFTQKTINEIDKEAYNMVIKNNIIYFTTYSSNSVYSYSIDSAPEKLPGIYNNCDGITIVNESLYICCTNGIYVLNTSNNTNSLLINIDRPSKITTDNTYLYFSSFGKIYKANLSGTYEELISISTDINGLLYKDKLYYVSDGIIYSYALTPIIRLKDITVKPGDINKQILGVNLLNVTNVYFNGTLLTESNYTIDSDFSITIKKIPSGTDTVYVYVKASVLGSIVDSNTVSYTMPSSYTVCFLAGTLIQTDQGKIRIEEIDIHKHTIEKNKIMAITKTIYETDETLVCFEKDSIKKNYPKKQTIISRKHKILDKNIFKEAERFINDDTIYAIKYNGEILYNVLLEKHYSMRVHNLICETLHPQNKVALFYKQKIKEGVSLDSIIIKFKKVNA
jgi:hypothetical protein